MGRFVDDVLAARLPGEAETLIAGLACAAIAPRYAPVDPTLLAPLYPRAPEAATKSRTLHAGKPRHA